MLWYYFSLVRVPTQLSEDSKTPNFIKHWNLILFSAEPSWNVKLVILRLTTSQNLKTATSRRSAMHVLYRNALGASPFLLVYLSKLAFCIQVSKERLLRNLFAYQNHRRGRIRLPSGNTWAGWGKSSEEIHTSERKWFAQKVVDTNQAWINLDQKFEDYRRNHLLEVLFYRNHGGNKQTKKSPTDLRLERDTHGMELHQHNHGSISGWWP